MLDRAEMMKAIKNAKKEVVKNSMNDCVRSAKTWSYNAILKIYITGVELTENGFVNIDTAIEVSPDVYAEESFHFKYEGAGKGYWDKFLENVVPDQSQDLNVADLIGKCFKGQIVQNEGYDNLEALDSCDDDLDETDDSLSDEDDVDELPFD